MLDRLRTPLIDGNKRRARLLLYSVPLLLLFLTLGAVWVTRTWIQPHDWRQIRYDEFESVRLFREYLRIDTSYPTGNEIPGAEFLARQLRRIGLDPHVERIGHRNANVWAVIEGERKEALVLHNHIDVDPVRSPDDWYYPPFSPVIDLPFITGRGAFDMKSVTIAQLMAVKRLLAEGVKLRRSIVFLATGDEERGSRLGTQWFLREHPELTERFAVVLTEGGAVEATETEDVKYWGTEVLQKRFARIEVCHSRRDLLEHLRGDLQTPYSDFEYWHSRELPPVLVDYLRSYVKTRSRPDFVFYLEDFLAGGGGFPRLPRNIKSLIRNELWVSPVREDPGGGFSLEIWLHLLPWAEEDEAVRELLPAGLREFATAIEPSYPPLPLDRLLGRDFETIAEVVEELHPEFHHGPLFVPWAATDSRFFRRAGIPSYGFSPFLILSSDSFKITGPNERMIAPAFVEGVGLYVELVRRLADRPDAD